LSPEHDFKRFPELANAQMEEFYFKSPHKQILYSFHGIVEKVVDGDTIRVSTNFRDFETVVRFLGTNAPEMNEGGEDAKDWLENLILDREVYIVVIPTNRVGKWGRILGTVYLAGENMNQLSILMGHATPFDQRNLAVVPDPYKASLESLANVRY